MVLTDCSHEDEIDSPEMQTVSVISRTVKDPIHAMGACFFFFFVRYKRLLIICEVPLTPRLSTFIDTWVFNV